ncbi:hypothetical protein FACS1894205_5170 [Alphaproteobacteria bacterium]|nr:hypothetical protein FACS1894205_5170 [Alphaproteobacteria bacterium]
MKTVYFKSDRGNWKYELEDEEFEEIIAGILEDGADFVDMLEESIEILRDLSQLDEEDMDEDDEIDQTVAIAFIWHYFNSQPRGAEDRIEGDVVLIEDEDGSGVSVLSADELEEED